MLTSTDSFFLQGSIPASLSSILRVYEIKQPPASITVKQIFDKIIGSVHLLFLPFIPPSLLTHPHNSHRLVMP